MSVPCRKISYPTRGHANKELRRIAKEGSHWPAHTPRRAYKCTVCGLWHLTCLNDQKRRNWR